MSVLMNHAVLRNTHNFHELRSREFERPAGGEVLGIAGDPQWIESMRTGQRQEQAYGTGRIAMSPVRGENGIADMARIHFDMPR